MGFAVIRIDSIPCGSIRCDLIQFDFDLVRFDLVRCDSMWFVYALQIDSVWSDLGRFNSSLFQLIQFDLVLSYLFLFESSVLDLIGFGLIQYASIWFDSCWVNLIPCCSNRSDSIWCASIRIDPIWFHPIQPLLVWLYVIRVCFRPDMMCVGSICFGSIWVCLLLFDSMWLDSIWWGVVRFHSIWFDDISCDSIWFVLLWLNVIQCWFDSRDLVSSGVTRFNSMLLFDSISFVLFCLDALRFDSCLSICIWFKPIWFDSVSSCSSLVWFTLTWFYEVGVDSMPFCLIQVPLALVDVIRFERWWFYSIWFALIWFDLIRLTFCEHI